MIPTDFDKPPQLPYRFEFGAGEWQEIKRCHDDHGFAVIKGMLHSSYVEKLKAEVERVLDSEESMQGSDSSLSVNFIECAPAFWELFQDVSYIDLYRHLLGSPEITIHRSAAIRRLPGASGMHWHTDHVSFPAQPPNCNAILNHHDWPNGAWFYLNGLHPCRGGLAIIPDSHRADWPGPPGFQLSENRDSFHRVGAAPVAHNGMDVPGALALHTEPEDMVLFAARTYHAVFPHQGEVPRLACAVVCRPSRPSFPAPWPLPMSALRFIDAAPSYLRPFLDGYTGIDMNWKGES